MVENHFIWSKNLVIHIVNNQNIYSIQTIRYKSKGNELA